MTYYNANKTKDTTVPKFNRQFVETAVIFITYQVIYFYETFYSGHQFIDNDHI
jgi:hypothetical protein